MMNFYKLIEFLKERERNGLKGVNSAFVFNHFKIKRNHASTLLRRCWKMGLLRRKGYCRPRGGISYFYHLTKFGWNYERKTILNNENEEQKDILLAEYIISCYDLEKSMLIRLNKPVTQNSNIIKLKWARIFLFPEMLRRINKLKNDEFFNLLITQNQEPTDFERSLIENARIRLCYKTSQRMLSDLKNQ